ncbi:MAG: hypothetical protein IJ072_06410 [Oscillospiraceae bacterium]|nr:hypothetical protein [Oscillospiraceae bacterium]
MECCKCRVEMEERDAVFTYLGHELHHSALCCPLCGQVFIPEELVDGKITEVETMLEDK